MGKQEEIKEKVENFYASRKLRDAEFSREAKRQIIVVLAIAGAVLLVVGLIWCWFVYLGHKQIDALSGAMWAGLASVIFALVALSAASIAIWKVVSILISVRTKWKNEDKERDDLVKELVSLGCSREEVKGYLSELSEAEVEECLKQAFDKEGSE